jgi:hypothetical protein
MKNPELEQKLIQKVNEAVEALGQTSGDLTREEKDADAVRMRGHLAQYTTATDLYDRWSELMLEDGVDPPSKWAFFMLRGIGMYNPMTLRGMRNHFVSTRKMTEKQMALYTMELVGKRLVRVVEDEKGRAVYWVTKEGERMLRGVVEMPVVEVKGR